MSEYKFKVHSAIYSCNSSESCVTSGYDVTGDVQEILRTSNTDGVLEINNDIIKNSNSDIPKCFAIIVTVVYPNGEILTRFCSSSEGNTIDLKVSGVVCSF
ncbi:MAG: hypothetical protein EVB11_08400 [Winogradskyella sp.]|nr:MAG: hypothetical protein EVB11_08400 [Winogradskyella sp.]